MSNNQVMWIRSQDDKYIPQGLYPINMGWLEAVDGEIIFNYFVELDSYFAIGRYSTEKRAIEVLDEIESNIVNGQTIVFHIPKE